MREEWRSGDKFPNKYDRKCVDCGAAIPKNSRDYFYRKTPGGDYESMCLSCMNKLPAEGPGSDDSAFIIAEAINGLTAFLKACRDEDKAYCEAEAKKGAK